MHIYLIFLGWYSFLAFVNGTAVDMKVQMSFWHTDFISFGHILSGEIAGIYESLFLIFEEAMHNGCTNLHSYQLCRILFTLYSDQHLLYFVFDNSHSSWSVLIAHLGFICIFLVISDAEHCFRCLLTIRMSFFKNCLFRYVVHFKIGLLGVCHLILCILCIFWILAPRQMIVLGT